MKQNTFYELVSENLTNLGGPMGTEYTFDNWRKPFSSLEKAKGYAEKDYKYQKERPISWQQQNDRWCSGNSSLEKKYLNIERQRGLLYLAEGFNLIVDDTNFNLVHEEYWKHIAEENNFEFEIKEFNTPLKECLTRNSLREKPVPELAIKLMHNKYIKNKPKFDDRLVSFDSKSHKVKAVIFDIDGTLALMNGRTSYDFSKVDTDKVNKPVMFLNNLLWASRFGEWPKATDRIKIILLSGREEACKEKTISWLRENNIIYDTLLMRKEKDFRADEIIKREIYEAEIQPHYEVVAVFDDRDKVVAMWRSLGLLCCQVYPGNF